jgi:hypothetical protein
MSLMAKAIKYAAVYGWHVFPCNPAGTTCPESGDVIDKQPHLLWPGKPYKIKWGEVATNRPDQVARWWQQSPEANIGIACRPSGLLVVDCDRAKDGSTEDGLDQFIRVVTDVLKLPATWIFDTYCVRTGSGGTHFYYRWPENVQASQAGLAAYGAPLVDIRSNGGSRGGYVLGAGSVTTKGAYELDYDTDVLPCPAPLVELCREKPRPERVSPLFQQPGGGSTGGLVDTVRFAVEGNRNDALNWAAYRMACDGLKEEQVMELLLPAAEECGLSEKETLDTIKSACRRAS